MLEPDSAYKYIAKDYRETLMFCLFAALGICIPILGVLLITGLTIRVISNSINNADEIPKVFSNFGEDVLNGLKYLAFIVILMIPFVAIFAGSFGSIIAAGMSGDAASIASMMLSLGSLWIFVIILMAAYALVVPALVANYAKEKKFSAFFEINKAFNLVFSNFAAYIKYVMISMLYSIVISAVTGIISFTIIGPILLGFLSILIYGKNMGEWYKEVSGKSA